MRPIASASFLRLASAGVLVCFVTGILHAQPDRIHGRIDNSRMVRLKGHVTPNGRAGDDRGPVDASTEISYATLWLQPTAAQQAALETLLIAQQDPSSANYHRWLTPEEYAGRFGLSQGDIAKIVSWLQSQGLKVNDVARGRRWITFSGTAANVGRGFHTEFHRYLTDGQAHFANTAAPSVPEALADVVAGIEGLDDYYPVPASRQAPKLIPDFNSTTGAHYLAPDDIATIYDVKPLYAAGIDGTGITIAVIGNTDIDLAQIRNYRSRFNLPPNDPKLVLVGGDPGTAAEDEAYLDLETAGAVARNAALVFVYARSVSTAAQYAVDQRIAPVITESFLSCEPGTTTYQRAVAQQANAEGITWMAATGDVGAAGCEVQGKLPQASKGKAVGSPASIPEVTAVGGSEFDEGSGTYWNRASTNGASAMSYIPEKSWNDSAADWYLAASTGGASMFYSKPWWQAGPGVPSDNARDVPDIALSASWSHDAYVISVNDGLYGSGGTSAATPVFAGMVALLNHYLMSKGALAQPGLGNINPNLYRLAQSAPGAFHDIASGDNVVPCMQGTPDCESGSFGYTAGPGYDLVTGLGSVDLYNLASAWTTAPSTSTTLAATPATIAFDGGSVKLTATVSAAGGPAAGEVTFLMNDTSLGTATLAASGGSSSATLTLNAMQFPVGANTVTAVYGGSGNLGASAGTATVTVTPPATASAVVPTVTPNPVYQQPADANGYTWFFTIRLRNQSAVAATLTKLTMGGTDYSSSITSWFGTATIPANGSIAVTLGSKNLNAPVDRVFSFAGTDASGASWSQQITVPFITRMIEEPSLLLLTPASVPADPSADASCRWTQPLVIEEQGGYDVQLSSLTTGKTDLSGQLQQIFGTTTLAPFGRLQGNLCWDSGTAAGSKSLAITGVITQSQSGGQTGASATTTLSSAATSGITPSVSPASVAFSGAGTQTATVALSFSSGSPQWTAKVSPTNFTTNGLKVAPASGTGAGQLTLAASPAGLANGVYSATVLIQCPTGKPQMLSVPVTLVVGGSSGISIGAVTNAASYKVQALAPGMYMTVWGTNLAPATQHAPGVPLPLSMQGVTVTVNGYTAPLLDVSPGQLNVQIPYETGAGTAVLGVNNNGQVAYFPFQMQASAPGIFMTLDGANNLVPYASGKRGQVLLAFITGEGAVSPFLITGKAPTTTDPTKLPVPGLPVNMTVGGVPATIDFIGIPTGLVGVTQINFTVPQDAPLGKNVPVVVTVGGVDSAPVNLNITQ